jgi:hypothetical protein
VEPTTSPGRRASYGRRETVGQIVAATALVVVAMLFDAARTALALVGVASIGTVVLARFDRRVAAWLDGRWRWGLVLGLLLLAPALVARVTASALVTPTLGVAPTATGACPPPARIKGNQSSMIFHLPGGAFYERTRAEVCFRTIGDAQRDGYRLSAR